MLALAREDPEPIRQVLEDLPDPPPLPDPAGAAIR